MATFTPPTSNEVNPTLPETRGVALLLFRFFTPNARGKNVWKLVNGTYTENEPADISDYTTLYLGGHIHTITAAEATSLTAAGYGAYIT